MSFSRSALLALAIALAGCSSAAPSAPTPAASAQAAATMDTLFPALAANVILPTYADLDDKAAKLDAAVQALSASPTDANLKAARDAWVAARAPWELSESHLFGPVEDRGLDPAMDSWPVDRNDLDKVLASGATLDVAFIGTQQDTLKGYHAIEYILFGNEAKDLTPRKLQYVTSLTADFHATASSVKKDWDPTGENYVAQYDKPAGSTAFGSTDVAFAQTLHAMADICEEVANSKIETPLAANDGTLEESHFSNTSMVDFRHNIEGVQRMYLGSLDGSSALGVGALVAAKDPAADAKFRAAMKQALADIDAVPGSFSEAIAAHPDALRKVQASVNAVRDALNKDVSTAVTGKVAADAT